MPRAPRRAPSTGALAALGAGMLALGVGLGLLLSQQSCDRRPGPRPEAPASPPKQPPPPTRAPVLPRPAPIPTLPAPVAEKPKLALVIDDVGNASPDLVQRLARLGIPLTIAVLPFGEFTAASSEAAFRSRLEVILHMPMEPIGYPGPHKDPGKGAILLDMDEAATLRSLREALATVPHCSGVNNHMGSRITPDRARMTWILRELKQRNLFFVDSRTEKDSAAFDIARDLGIPSVQRKVFLDGDPSAEGIRLQWARALDLARQDGEVLVIGHLHPLTVKVLEELVPAGRIQVRFVPASALAR